MSASGVGIEVFVFKGAKFLGSRCFSQASITIGRGREATLRLQDAAVDERHAVVKIEGGELLVADNRSRAGLFVNGDRVSIRALGSLDEVSIGPFRIKFSLLGQEEQATFGAESDPGRDHPPMEDDDQELPTTVARMEFPSERDGVTLPRIGLHGKRTDVEGAAERAQPFSARDFLDPRHPAREDPLAFADTATKNAAPSSLARRETRRPAAAAPEPEPPMARGRERGAARPQTRRAPAPAGQAPEPEAELESEPAAPRQAARVSQDEVETAASLPDSESGPLPDEEQDLAGEMRSAESTPEEDEDDEEAVWVEPFSLLENVVRERFKAAIATEDFCAVELIRYADNEVLDLLRADPGQSITIGSDPFNLLTVEETGRALLYFRKDFSGTLVCKGKARPLKAFCTDSYLIAGDQGMYGVTLQEGDYAQVLAEGMGYLVRFVKPPVLPRAPFRMGITAAGIQAFVASGAVHFLLLVLFAVLASDTALRTDDQAERFARVSLKDLNLEQAAQEPKPEVKKDEPPPPSKDVPKETPKVTRRVPREKTHVVSNVPAATKQKERAQKKAVANVMSALENLKPAGLTPGRSDLKALASNISAVRSPGGAAANFKVSGVIGRIGGEGVRLAGGLGGGGGRDTRVGSQLLGGGSKVGAIDALAGTGKKVRGKVARAPARAIQASGGQLSREAIQQVVGQHMNDVQACYERQLITSPGLSGKIVFDWVIEMSGGVSSARQASSSMASPAVATCILALIRTWRFPSPVGGSVQVRYPFVFRVQGF
jgi:pSer/pThr/pTyr-binding forkhead associated (FHA) protein